VTSAYTGGYNGDAILYNWNDGGTTYDHLSEYIGVAYVSTYYDSSINYTWQVNRYIDIVDQHSPYRYHSFWNLGYFKEYYFGTDPGHVAAANGMNFQVVHVNT
jgi:hypothetical protein